MDRNLRMRDHDNANGLWRADGDETTAITVQTLRSGSSSKPGSRQQELAVWAQGASQLLCLLRGRIRQLMAV